MSQFFLVFVSVLSLNSTAFLCAIILCLSSLSLSTQNWIPTLTHLILHLPSQGLPPIFRHLNETPLIIIPSSFWLWSLWMTLWLNAGTLLNRLVPCALCFQAKLQKFVGNGYTEIGVASNGSIVRGPPQIVIRSGTRVLEDVSIILQLYICAISWFDMSCTQAHWFGSNRSSEFCNQQNRFMKFYRHAPLLRLITA